LSGPDPSTSVHGPIKLIDRTTAAADADESVYSAAARNTPLSSFTAPAPQAGYWYAALSRDLTLKGEESVYRQDTAGTPPMGKVHNTGKFGFMAFPDGWSQGKFVFIVNENNTIYRRALTASPRRGTAVPPGLGG